MQRENLGGSKTKQNKNLVNHTQKLVEKLSPGLGARSVWASQMPKVGGEDLKGKMTDKFVMLEVGRGD